MKQKFISNRLPIALFGALCLCVLYVIFLLHHVSTVRLKEDDISVLARFEQNWIRWIKDENNKKGSLNFPLMPSDNKGQNLPYPDPLVACVFGENRSSLLGTENSAESALINLYLWFVPRLSMKTELLPSADISWDEVPFHVRSLESELPAASIRNYISACIAWNLLRIKNRDMPTPSVLLWMRNQATSLLENNYRQEGLAFLKLLAPFLSELDPEFNAWMGAAIIMQALDAVTGMEKIRFVEQGMQLLDTAILKANKNISCLYIRINTYLSLPEFYQAQHEQAIKDLNILVDALENNITFTYTSTEFLQEETTVDSEYLIKLIDWAQKIKGLSANSRRLLHKLDDRIHAIAAKRGGSL